MAYFLKTAGRYSSCFIVTCLLLIGCGENNLEPGEHGDSAPQLANTPDAQINVLVIGGTSGIGLETVKLSLERGHKVTVISRRPERMSLTHENLKNLQGDVLDAERVSEVTKDMDAIVNAIGIGPTREPVTVFSQGMQNILGAVQKSPEIHILTITGIGAGDSRGHGGFFYDNILQPLLLKTIYEDKDKQEEILFASDANWTIIRPGFLTDNAAQHQYRVIENMQGIRSGDISRSDVAHFIVAAYETQQYSRKVIFLSN